MPAGKICFKCPEFFGSYNPYATDTVKYWFCRAGQSGDGKLQVSEDSGLPMACPCKFVHAMADSRADKKIPGII